MENNASQLASILNIVLVVMVSILVILIVALGVIKLREISKQKENQPKKNKEKNTNSKKIEETYQKESVYDFMDFDSVEDNMIIRKKGTRFVMVIKCTGSNYDLASEDEKLAIE